MVQVHPEVEIGPGDTAFKDNETDLCPTYSDEPWWKGWRRRRSEPRWLGNLSNELQERRVRTT